MPHTEIRRELDDRKRSPTDAAQSQRGGVIGVVLFVSAFGKADERKLALAHFHQDPDTRALPTLRVVTWDRHDTPRHMETVGERLGNTAAVARASYVSPAVVEQYLDGRTIDDFRPRHLRVVGARDVELDVEEQSLLSLLRSHRIRRARKAA